MVNVSNRKSSDPDKLRQSYVIRQLEENAMGIQKEDFKEDGALDLESLQKRLSAKSGDKNDPRSSEKKVYND